MSLIPHWHGSCGMVVRWGAVMTVSWGCLVLMPCFIDGLRTHYIATYSH